ncbi:TonB-dependent receptor plug domain-containing protein [Ferrimonas marina]|uniref:Iron complex outermembrane recepter protein n=1 Tax=Ferrimonas marina TaxID=299255 RepID=A0A1M5RNN7_9GAMM|nr:TonB-dependent receptor [Ferrimonas marina]SHH27914.1 iron complex outermembrane recepter protein [Ferrimonas marina]
MHNSSLVSKAVRFALVAGATSAAFTAPAVFAEEEGVERIEVTGSRIKRTDLETASPITVFSSEDIANTGVATLEDFVQTIPAINGGAEGSSINNGSRGYATASLRGLGSGRTLVLINGRRFASGDLNSIPTSYVERVEVLRDGASTIYGSDAIAGVINFITKKDFEGLEVNAQYDVTSEGDGEKTLFSVTTGASNDKGNVVLSLQYTNREEIYQGDRSFSECPIFERDGAKVCGGSGTIPYGQYFYLDGEPAGGYVKDPGTGMERPFDQAIDGFNYATTSYMVTPQEVFSINGAGRYEITDNLGAFLEGGFTNRQSDQLMAPEGTFWGPVMPATNPGNPTGEDLVVYRRLRETAGRAFTQDFSDYRMVFGLEGTVGEFDWDIAYNFARFVDSRLDLGRVNPTRIENLLDPALCAEDPACLAAAPDGSWDILTAGTLTQDMIDYAFVPNSPVIRGETRQLMANISGGLFGVELPGGEIMWAAGYEKRWEEYQSVPDGAASIGQIYSVAGDPTEGAYSIDEVYAEFDFPILSGMFLAESLRFTAAVRYSDFDFLDDSSTNTKFGLEWAPIDGLLLRTTFAEGFRAPGITELFAPQAETNLAYNDPCENWGTTANATVAANCQSEEIPADFELSSDQSSTIVGGNPDLKPEESESFTAGFVYSTDFGLSFGMDYYDIEITNGIGTAGTDNVINGCYNSANFSSGLCDFILGPEALGEAAWRAGDYRNALGNVSGILLTNANLSTFETSGIDFDISYATELGGGDFSAVLNGTYLDKYNYVPFEGAEKVELAGKVGADQWETTLAAFAEWRTNLTLNYAMDNWAVSWQTRYQSESEDLFASEDNLDNYADSIFYHDVQGTYFVLENTALTLGVKNLFDEEAPYISNNQDMNTIPASYDTAGQYWYGRITVKF